MQFIPYFIELNSLLSKFKLHIVVSSVCFIGVPFMVEMSLFYLISLSLFCIFYSDDTRHRRSRELKV